MINATVIGLNDEYVAAMKDPAVPTWCGDRVAILDSDKKLVGYARTVSGWRHFGADLYMEITVKPDDDATKAFFGDQLAVQLDVGFRYDGVLGVPLPRDPSWEEDFKGSSVMGDALYEIRQGRPAGKQE